jgi:hypothetical protein
MSVVTREADGTRTPPTPTPGNGRGRLIRRAVLAVLTVVVVVVAVSWTHAPWRDFVHRKPASYVEISFVQPERLPSTIPSGGSVRFSFLINNVEPAHSQRTISWVTSVRDAVTGTAKQVGTGSAVLTGGTTRTVQQRVTVTGTHRSEVSVKLATGQQIDFFVVPKSP